MSKIFWQPFHNTLKKLTVRVRLIALKALLSVLLVVFEEGEVDRMKRSLLFNLLLNI